MDMLNLFFISIFIFFLLISLVIGFTRKNERLAWLDKRKTKKNKKASLLSNEERAYISTKRYLSILLTTFIAGLVLSMLMNNVLVILVALALGWVTIKSYVMAAERKTRNKVKDQLGPALQAIGSSYQAQKNWLYALREVIPLLQEPVKSEIERVKNLHETGMPISEAFKNMQTDLNIPELQLFVTMVEVSQEAGSEVAEGIITAGAYFQQRKIRMQEIANAMMSGLSENKILTYAFIAIVVGFRLFKEDMFRGFTHTLIGQILLAFFLSVAVLCLFISMRISRKEI